MRIMENQKQEKVFQKEKKGKSKNIEIKKRENKLIANKIIY